MKTPSTTTAQISQQLQLVSFTVGEELFAVDILTVQEINRMIALTKVPQSPPGVQGVINLRGRIIPILDLRIQFGITPTETNENSRIIVVEISGNTVGFIVDSVHEMLRIDRNIVEPSPRMSISIDSSYVAGVAKLEGELLILLDLDNLLGAETMSKIIQSTKAAA